MKKKIIGIAMIILVIGIGAVIIYKTIEKDVMDRESFNYKTSVNGSIDTVSHDEHSFHGKIVEVTSSYLIVEPNENEDAALYRHKPRNLFCQGGMRRESPCPLWPHQKRKRSAPRPSGPPIR